MKKLLYITILQFIIYSALAANTNNTDSLQVKQKTLSTSQQAYMHIRGIERDEKAGFRALYTLKKTVLFVPEQFSAGIKYASGYGIELVNNPKFINDLEYIFFTQDKTLGWYPTASLTSGLRPRIGINFIMKKSPVQLTLKAKYADEEKYKIETRASYFVNHDDRLIRLNFEVLHEYDDDRKYYGFGADPRNDSRNQYVKNPKSKYGYFFQEHTAVRLISGYKPLPNFNFYLMTSFDQRIVKDAFEGDNWVSHTFLTSSIPGMNSTYNQWYNELSLKFDSQPNTRYFSTGSIFEAYTGINRGFGNNPNLSLKSGITVYKRFAVLNNNRILTPKLTVHAIRNLDKNKIIPFTEYPHHEQFRGVNERTYLRLDNHLLIPSIQYSWPLSQNIGAHIFADYLTASSDYRKLSFTHSVWAAGFIFDLHSRDDEMANIKIIYGSEGLRLHADIGVSFY